MVDRPDPLWDPALPGDDELVRLEALLGRYRHVPAEGQAWALPPISRAPRWRRPALAMAAVLVACAVGIAAWLPWRLQWSEHHDWAVETDAPALPRTLRVGQTLATSAGETATVQVARIGRMQVLPGTRVRLVDTRTGHHRLELLDGRVRARIWAPPGYFGIAAGDAETVDLGCAFEMQRNLQGEGDIRVLSGWVMHRVQGQETLVPAGSHLRFDASRSGIPLAETASVAFAAQVEQLDLAMAKGERVTGVEAQVAERATDDDRFTILTLLTRYPALASGPLYPRLAAMFGETVPDPAHRQAWQQGSVHAMNRWWEQVPRPPKAWWLNWRDALG